MATSRTYRRSHRKCILASCFLFLLLVTPSMQCGPGPRAGRRHPRKRTPLVFKQHLPNVSENNLGASGPTDERGPILRSDSRFKKELLMNTNPDIVFKEEEGNQDDRLMTQRCKDKVNTLAISVMNQWPNVKLRITEAWDEKRETGPIMHARDSLHYEGRAVDITTSDRDRSKYGMLARLAYEAGFDWVYYESRGHIHCSVKSDSSIAVKTGGCFSGQMEVTVPGGTSLPMSHIQVGDNVLTLSDDGRLVYDMVIAFFHQNPIETAYYLTLHTANGKQVSMTPDHLIYASGSNASVYNFDPIFTRNVLIGDFVLTKSGDKYEKSMVVGVKESVQKGLYAPLTKHGTVVVNHVITSCYAVIYSHDIAHASLAPLRWAHQLADLTQLLGSFEFNRKEEVHTDVHWYAQLLLGLAQVALPSSFLYPQ
uniref:Hedgehog protein n=1 Tax=Urechis unicinctus TaxID=6432 RepID=A0A2P1K6G4_UREUN|nr:hedgehog [Urechis unicinctus]